MCGLSNKNSTRFHSPKDSITSYSYIIYRMSIFCIPPAYTRGEESHMRERENNTVNRMVHKNVNKGSYYYLHKNHALHYKIKWY